MSNKQIERSTTDVLPECIYYFIRGYKTAAMTVMETIRRQCRQIKLDPVPEWSTEAEVKVFEVCIAFINDNKDDVTSYANKIEHHYTSKGRTPPIPPWDLTGQDLYLTCTGEAIGFRESGFGWAGKRLTKKCYRIRESYLTVGDDGKLYLKGTQWGNRDRGYGISDIV